MSSKKVIKEFDYNDIEYVETLLKESENALEFDIDEVIKLLKAHLDILNELQFLYEEAAGASI